MVDTPSVKGAGAKAVGDPECVTGMHPRDSRAYDLPSGKRYLNRVGLLFGEVTDEREFPLLALVSLDQKDNPQDQLGQSEQRKQEESQDRDEAGYEGDGNASNREEQALEGMEPHKTVLVEGFDEKKDDRRDNKVSEGPSQIVRQGALG
jgi:hypothetical protein